MAIQILLIEQTDFIFYPIKIRLEMAEIWPNVTKQLATAIMGDQLVASQMASAGAWAELGNYQSVIDEAPSFKTMV